MIQDKNRLFLAKIGLVCKPGCPNTPLPRLNEFPNTPLLSFCCPKHIPVGWNFLVLFHLYDRSTPLIVISAVSIDLIGRNRC